MAYVFRQGDLPKLDLQVDRGTDFSAWKSQWEAYLSLSGLGAQAMAKRVQALTLCFSRETVTIVENLGLSVDQRADVGHVVTAIQQYVDGQINESVERRNFRRRTQQQGETFDDFLVSLRELAKTCRFCTDECCQKHIRDQIIEGLLDGDAVEDLLKERDLTLEAAVTMCRAQEAARKQRAEISGGTQVNVVRRQQQPARRSDEPTGKTCFGCGYQLHPGGRQQCPALNRTCRSCGRPGHLARVCRRRQAPQMKASSHSAMAVHVEQPLEEGLPQVNASAVAEKAFDPAPMIDVTMSSLNGQATVRVLPDSGADVSVAGELLLEHLQEHPGNLLPSGITPRAVNGTLMRPIGRLPVALSLDGQEFHEDFHIYPEVRGILLSWKASRGLGILPECYPRPLKKACVANVSTVCDLVGEFPSVFDGKVKVMEGEKFHISLTEDAQPFCVRAPRTIPFAYRDKLKEELDLLQAQGVIAPVTTPTEWCAPIVVTPKKNSDRIRLCVDLSRLNRHVRRERYQSITPAQAVADIAAENAKLFTKLDALKGYHQCPLDEDSQPLTTFITPFGRFKFLRAPYGLSSISEHYNRRMDEAFEGLSGYRRIVDDVIIFDSDEAQHARHVKQFLSRCAEKSITLNLDKWQFAQTEVLFAGFLLSPEGYRIDRSITDAIAKFPTPASRTDLRSFIGLVNQLSASTPAIAGLLNPLRPLLSTKNDFVWSPGLDEAFGEVKSSLVSAPILSFFDPSRPTRICTDASRQGLGFVLQQKLDDTWVLVQAGSRFLSDPETRYAVIELELLAVSWAIIKCNIFLAGLRHFTVMTDHHPLIPILNSHRLDEIENPRLQRLKTRIMAYNFTAEWIKGSLNSAPDALSRNPVSDPSTEEMLAERSEEDELEMSIAEIRAVASNHQESVRLQVLRQYAGEDVVYQQLLHYIRDGFPEHRSQLPEECRRFWNVRSHLSVDEGLVVYGCRLVIPAKMQREVLSQLHEAHQGSIRTRQRARLSVYWPGIDNDIDNIVASCKHCQDRLPSHPKEPLITKPRPERPFQEIAVDFCSYGGHDFLVLVDCFTDWPEIVHMGRDTTTPRLITALRQAFCRSGAPDVVWSDQGPQFTSRSFRDFSFEWGFQHVMSSPHYPQSNGKAEAAVKSMKNLISAAWTGSQLDEARIARALLQYRNTPSRRDGLSPAQKLYGRPIQDTLPAHRRAFAPEWQRSVLESEKHAQSNQEYVQQHYDQHAHSLMDIHVGSNVALQDPVTRHWDIYGIVTDVGPHRRYYVRTAGGRVLVRNRRHVRRRVPLTPHPTSTSVHPATGAVPPFQPAPPRHSTRRRVRPQRLIEEITF